MNPQPPRVRRDPRDPASSVRARPRPGSTPTASEDAVLRVDAPACHVLAVADLEAGRLSRADRHLMGAARQLADALRGALVLVACLLPGQEFRADPQREGADRLALLRDPAFRSETAEIRLAAVLGAIEACAARHVLFGETVLGGELARRVAARLGDRIATGVRRLSAETLVAEIDAGRIEVTRPLPRVIVPEPGIFDSIEAGPMREARPLELSSEHGAERVRPSGVLPLDPGSVPLAEAELIISAGAGLTDWPSFHAAARALGAAEAGSRVVCDAGLLPRARQVGASGTLVEPRCYLAFGIAGAAQHLHGIAAAERVVAVNTDLRADMIKRADLAIVADAQAVLPALVRRAAERAAGGLDPHRQERKDRDAA